MQEEGVMQPERQTYQDIRKHKEMGQVALQKIDLFGNEGRPTNTGSFVF